MFAPTLIIRNDLGLRTQQSAARLVPEHISRGANVLKQKTNEAIAIAGRVSFCERTSGNELQGSKPARAFFAIFLSRGKKVDEI